MLTTQVKLLPTPEQEFLLLQTMQEYIALVNDIVDYAIAIDKMPKLSSASVHAPLPAALRDQYQCRVCGYVTHRDRVGAVNICRAA